MNSSTKIKSEIIKKATQLQELNPFFVKVRTGNITKAEIASYLFNLMHVLASTPDNLKVAASKAIEMDMQELAIFLDRKIIEETDHHLWALQDLEHLDFSPQANQPTIETLRLIQFIKSLTESDPRLYLVYMTFVEYFTAQAAPEFLSSLETLCEIPRKNVSVIANHEEKDKGHSEEGFEWLGRFTQDSSLENQIINTIQASHQLVSNCITSCSQ